MGAAAVLTALEEAERWLGKVDLVLLHWPGGHGSHLSTVPDCAQRHRRHRRISWRRCRVESYEALLSKGTVGVSNFAARHLLDLEQEGLTPPAVHQLEFHLAYQELPPKGSKLQAYGCLGGALHTQKVLIYSYLFLLRLL